MTSHVLRWRRTASGCYWYPRETAAPVTNRTLDSIAVPPGTCDYVDIAGLCLLTVTPKGRLSWSKQQPAIDTVHQRGGNCAELAAVTAEDARAATRQTPKQRFYWVLSGTMDTMQHVFNDTALRSALVSDLANFSRQHPDVTHLPIPTSARTRPASTMLSTALLSSSLTSRRRPASASTGGVED